jgi:anti-sigma regulatory factor (Ser/Thr protein kinase)
MSTAPNRHLQQVRNDLAAVAAAVERVPGVLAACGCDPGLQSQFALAFDELLSNLVKYGYPDDGVHLIECEIGREGDTVVAVIRDDGVPFNPLNQPSPDTSLPLEAREMGGLGIHLVRRLFDEVRYQRRDGRNVLTLVQHGVPPS